MRKIHPEDVFVWLQTNPPRVLVKYKKPWWGYLIPGFFGPYKGEIFINGEWYEQDVNAPRMYA